MLSPELGSQVDHADVTAYLEAHGWSSVPSRRPYAAIYRSGREPLVEVQVPLDRGLIDYGEAMVVIARRLAEVERRPAEAILGELLCFRPAGESPPSQFEGKVIELMGEPGDRGEIEGAVIVLVQADDAALRMRVVLGASDYRAAAIAHLEQRNVTVRGVLRPGTRSHCLEMASDFGVIGSSPTSD